MLLKEDKYNTKGLLIKLAKQKKGGMPHHPDHNQSLGGPTFRLFACSSPLNWCGIKEHLVTNNLKTKLEDGQINSKTN